MKEVQVKCTHWYGSFTSEIIFKELKLFLFCKKVFEEKQLSGESTIWSIKYTHENHAQSYKKLSKLIVNIMNSQLYWKGNLTHWDKMQAKKDHRGAVSVTMYSGMFYKEVWSYGVEKGPGSLENSLIFFFMNSWGNKYVASSYRIHFIFKGRHHEW